MAVVFNGRPAGTQPVVPHIFFSLINEMTSCVRPKKGFHTLQFRLLPENLCGSQVIHHSRLLNYRHCSSIPNNFPMQEKGKTSVIGARILNLLLFIAVAVVNVLSAASLFGFNSVGDISDANESWITPAGTFLS
jgi:hypothetical protein